MSTEKFAIGTEWKTRGGWKAKVIDVEPKARFSIYVKHQELEHGLPSYHWHFVDGSAPRGSGGHDIILPWAEPGKDAAFAAMLAALKEAYETLTGEDGCDIAPCVGSMNPHEHAAGLVRAAIIQAEAAND